MKNDPVVMLHNLVLSLSDALDLIHPCAVNHQQRVAYVSLRLAQTMKRSVQEQADLMYAAILHDIGILSVEEKIDSMQKETEDCSNHAELGAKLMQQLDIFSNASEIIKWHHQPWSDNGKWQDIDEDVRIFANIVNLADTVDRLVEKGENILDQVEFICKAISELSSKEFCPGLVECFQELASEESFWFDFTSHRIYSVLLNLIVWPAVRMELDGQEQIGRLFSKIVDFRSHFTATHSVMVATTARELAKMLNFGEKECRQMQIAGHLHDLGKVAIPNSILEKRGKLDPVEFNIMKKHAYHTFHILSTITGFEEIVSWASFHHERLDGQGYPFHINGEEITLGARIMHVADVFVALAENRPYRKKMDNAQVKSTMRKMADDQEIDDRIMHVLFVNYEEIKNACSVEADIHTEDYIHLIKNTPV